MRSFWRVWLSTALALGVPGWGTNAALGDDRHEGLRDEEAGDPCYVTIPHGPCGENTSVVVNCDGGTPCEILSVSSGFHYTAQDADGDVGLKGVSAKDCTVVTVVYECRDNVIPGQPQLCVFKSLSILLVAGSIATGDPCPLKPLI